MIDALQLLAARGVRFNRITRSSDHAKPGDFILGHGIVSTAATGSSEQSKRTNANVAGECRNSQ